MVERWFKLLLEVGQNISKRLLKYNWFKLGSNLVQTWLKVGHKLQGVFFTKPGTSTIQISLMHYVVGLLSIVLFNILHKNEFATMV